MDKLTRGQARQIFNEKLSYDRVLRPNMILFLGDYLKDELDKFNKDNPFPYITQLDSKSLKIKINRRTGKKACYITGSGHYFRGREVISFNEDGFIGFSGNADDTNIQPILRAFLRWVRFFEDAPVGVIVTAPIQEATQ